MPTLTGVSYGQGSGGAGGGGGRGRGRGPRRGGVTAVLGQGSGGITVSPGTRPGTYHGSGGTSTGPGIGPVAGTPPTPPKPPAPPPNPLAGLDPGLQAALAAAAKNPRPIDPQEMAAENVANRNYAGTDANLTAEEGGIRQGFGFDDPSNPFNKLALLKQNFERAKLQSQNSYASRGQLYSGALQSNQNDVRGNYDQNYAGLRGQYDSLLADIVRRRSAAGDARTNAFDTAEGDAIARALSKPPDPDVTAVNPPKPPAASPPITGPTGKPPKPSKPKTTTKNGVTTVTGTGTGQGRGSTTPVRGQGRGRRGRGRRPGVSAVMGQGSGSITVPSR